MAEKLRLLICGDRHWEDQLMVYDALAAVKDRVALVIDGGADGADTKGHIAAVALRLRTARYFANWPRYGRAAGPLRNQRMLDHGRPTEVWAFHDALTRSKGTADMLRRAKKAGIPVKLFSHRKEAKR